LNILGLRPEVLRRSLQVEVLIFFIHNSFKEIASPRPFVKTNFNLVKNKIFYD